MLSIINYFLCARAYSKEEETYRQESGKPRGHGAAPCPDVPAQCLLVSAIRYARPVPAAPPSPAASPIHYPSPFPIKVMGLADESLVQEVLQIARRFDPGFDASTLETRHSSGGKYLGVTVTVTASSRQQLDDLYRALSAHPLVKVVL